MSVQIKSCDAREILDGSAALEELANGFQFTEGPAWSAREQCLYFTDIPADRIYRWSATDGLRVFREPSGRANGLALDDQGRLIACEHARRRVSRTEADGTLRAMAEACDGRRLNSPNDIVVKSDGSLYFTDPDCGLPPGEQTELGFNGVFRLSSDLATLTLLLDDFARPNGLAFSPNEATLYVADTIRRHVRAFEVRPDGTLANSRLFATLEGDAPGPPDGMAVDREGHLFATGPGGLWVFAPDGEEIARIAVPQRAANVTWGGPDRSALFIAGTRSLYRLQTRTSGA